MFYFGYLEVIRTVYLFIEFYVLVKAKKKILLCLMTIKHFQCHGLNYALSLFSTFQTWWPASIPSAREWSCRTFRRACFGSVTDVTKTNSSSLLTTRILAGWPRPVCWTMTPWPLRTSLATSALWVLRVVWKNIKMVDQENTMNDSNCVQLD